MGTKADYKCSDGPGGFHVVPRGSDRCVCGRCPSLYGIDTAVENVLYEDWFEPTSNAEVTNQIVRELNQKDPLRNESVGIDSRLNNAISDLRKAIDGTKKVMKFKENREKLDAICYDIMESKRPAYTIMDDDPMRNFKSVASRMHLTPMQVALVYFLKHVDAICSTISAGNTTDPEPLEGRFADARNYIDILYHLWVTRDE